MNTILWMLVGGVTGWLTGNLIEEREYGAVLIGGYGKGLDIIFGIIGAFVGGYLFFWVVIGEGSLFSKYATAILGSIAVVGFVRQISARYLTSSRYKGIS